MYPLAITPSMVTFYRTITHCGLDIDIDAVKIDNIFLTTRISSGVCPYVAIVTLTITPSLPLTTANVFFISIILSFQDCYIKWSGTICNLGWLFFFFLTQHNFLELH